MTPPRNKAALFVFVTVVLDAMGIGIIMPVLPDLLRELSHTTLGEAALWGGYLSFTYALMNFLFSPVIGALSDRYGRRPVLLISLGSLAVDYLIMAFAPTLWILFIGRVLAGISGATYSTATAYIADVTPKDQRAAAFGLVGAGFGVGFVLGPVVGGLMGELGTRAPFYAAAALAMMNFLYGWFVLPESLSAGNRRAFEIRRANPFGAFAQMVKVPMVIWFVAATFLYSLAHHVYPAIWSFYTKEAFDWSARAIGISLALVGVGFAVVQGGLIHLILRTFGTAWTAGLGMAIGALGLLGLAFAWSGWVIYAMIPVTALGAIVTPALTGLMANRVSDDAQGELQGLLASVQAVTAFVSPLMMTQLFAAFTVETAPVYFPGAPFLAAALIMMLALIPLRIGLSRSQRADDESPAFD